jgi:hypothetical protein
LSRARVAPSRPPPTESPPPLGGGQRQSTSRVAGRQALPLRAARACAVAGAWPRGKAADFGSATEGSNPSAPASSWSSDPPVQPIEGRTGGGPDGRPRCEPAPAAAGSAGSPACRRAPLPPAPPGRPTPRRRSRRRTPRGRCARPAPPAPAPDRPAAAGCRPAGRARRRSRPRPALANPSTTGLTRGRRQRRRARDRLVVEGGREAVLPQPAGAQAPAGYPPIKDSHLLCCSVS